MSNPVRLLLLADDTVMSEEFCVSIGLPVDDTITEKFPGSSWVEFWIRPKDGNLLQKIRQEARTLIGGKWVSDETLEPAARCEIMIEKWSLTPGPSKQAFLNIKSLALADAIDGAILNYMFPNIYNNSDFTKASRPLQQPSAQDKASE